jgi:hypothetical protein
MEPENRPYIDPATSPGDAGTEAWSDTPPSEEAPPVGPLAEPNASTGDGVVVGSPAAVFIEDSNAIEARQDADEGTPERAAAPSPS